MRAILIPLLFVLSSCTAVPQAIPLPGTGATRGPFIPRDEFPVPPNVERLIGPEDCRGSTLAAVSADIPDYPVRAWSLGRQGWVVVRFDVEADGDVDNVRIARAVPDGPFNRESRQTVRAWQFRPLDAGVDRLDNCVVMFEFRAGEVALR
ncbi:TonB family protein [Maricaulis sp.]|uniref:TonB family protein n=1 Tax=Maricaulis sp. TaxID=1486257 RepID=UPI001B0C1720|nr:TonB family protein [Maricaulis sp.]MBO6765497.1 TonB family protein [Maricaulis sp.]